MKALEKNTRETFPVLTQQCSLELGCLVIYVDIEEHTTVTDELYTKKYTAVAEKIEQLKRRESVTKGRYTPDFGTWGILMRSDFSFNAIKKKFGSG